MGLLLAGFLIHLWYLLYGCTLDLSGDEAHYWEWARRPALSYYSKGPLVAYIIALARPLLADWSQRLLGNEVLAVRLPAMLLSLGTGLGLYTLAARTLRSPHVGLAVVALTFTVPIFSAGAFLMTIDAPLACLYVWALVAVERGLRSRRTWPWVVVGVLIALGILAKYTMMLIFPAIGLALLVEPTYRAVLRRPGPYLAVVVGLLGLVPIVVWNAEHNWVSFRHVAGQAGLTGGHAAGPLGPVLFLTGQAAVVGPIWFVGMVCAVVALWRTPGPGPTEQHAPATIRLLLCATMTPWLVFLGFSFITKIQPNWPVLALLPGSIVLVTWLARLLRAAKTRRAARVLIVAGGIVGSACTVVLHHTEWLMPAMAWLARNEPPWNLTPVVRYDPTARLRGWSQLGAAVGRVLDQERSAGHDPFVATGDYQTASEIAFYCPGEPPVYCLQGALGGRQSQYDIWPNPVRETGQFVGRSCVYVGPLRPELTGKGGLKLAALPGLRLVETVEHRVSGHTVRIWPVYVCEEYAGWPAELGQDRHKY